MSPATQTPFDSLKGENFIRLTTFRKNGTPVPTPVWFARDGDRLIVTTSSKAGKVKRLRHTPHVQLIASGPSGNPRQNATHIEAQAHFLPESDYPYAENALSRKYTWQYALIRLLHRLRGGAAPMYIEITA